MAERSKRFQSAVLLFALILLIFLFTAIALSFLPQDLSDLAGRNEDGTITPSERNLERVLENAAEKGIKVTLSEEEINQWLSSQLSGTQEGLLQNTVKFRSTWVRINDGSIDLIFEREAFNRLHTVAMNVEIEQLIDENDHMSSTIHRKGGRLGQLPVPHGYLTLVMSSYRELASTMATEVRLLKKMLEGTATIDFSEGVITFTPRSIGADSSLNNL